MEKEGEEWGKRRCVIIIRGTSRRWIRIDNSKRVITCPIQNRCQREKCGWDTGVDVIENKRGRVGGGVEWSRRVGGEETDTRIRRPSICVLSRRAGRFFVRGIIEALSGRGVWRRCV